QALTADPDTLRAVAMSRCVQPRCFSRRACLRRHCLKSGPGNGSVVMNHWVAVPGPMATEVEQRQHPGLASRPAWNGPLATPKHPSDGDLIRGEAATIASPQVPPVDRPNVASLNPDACPGAG